ncbi:GntR family transcriptional regulator [Niallia circulans]|jgi:GntR family transcriptional regulator, rspAB operon transcriptional repressor|uniref:GntR family transcriptional regulator n=2 Tax=Shouchella clausii TaxID=79880 RepID=UPI000BA4F48C|nr:hypothetical protein CHH76_15535 [Shouchella clausii]PAE78782.1 hypothetical protein CHH78_19180 [Shouchella clausii]PAF03616.1 hypothetical protein CHH66_19220 [Shouchella clausii]PAF12380.1 hypothetical protein CHH59_18745 [Shouchella clausii]SPU17708.1 GntR family transcriptional regulator [Niallia circulans]
MMKEPLQNKRKTLAGEVYNHLYNQIITLKYKPGQMIYESELALSLGISRTPVREAIHLLASEGFLRIIPQKGIQVEYISAKKVREAFQVRLCLEAEAFRQAAIKWGELSQKRQYKAELNHIIEEQQKSAAAEDVDQFYHFDEVFHDKVLKISGNKTLSEIVRQVRGHVNRMRYLEFFETREMDRIIQDHKQLVALIEAGDGAGVAAKLTDHLENISRYYNEIMKKYGDYFDSHS